MGLGRSRGAPWPSRQQPLSSSRRRNISRRLRVRLALPPLMTLPISSAPLFQPILLPIAALSRRNWPQRSSSFRRNTVSDRPTRAQAEPTARRQGPVTRQDRFTSQEVRHPTPFQLCHGLKPGSHLSPFLCNITPRPSIRWSRVYRQPQLNGDRCLTSSPDKRRLIL